MIELSACDRYVAEVLRRCGGDIGAAHAAIDELVEGIPAVDLAALWFDWSFWARPKQLAPSTAWRRWGFLTGRGFGKTIAISRYINERVEREPGLRILVVAQDEQSAKDIQIHGPSGLIATAPPWNRPTWVESDLTLIWPNGATATVRTPESPGKVRGPEYHLAWASELQSWPVATREETWSNVLISARLGRGQVVFDCTPKKGHPILKEVLADSKFDVDAYPVVRGSLHENAENLAEGYSEALERKYGSTAKGREEIDGEMLEESEAAMVRSAWIKYRQTPGTLRRCVLGIDPAATSKQASDTTGIVRAGLTDDGKALLLKNRSGRYQPHEWADIALDEYVDGCDLILAETNKGGEMVAGTLRAAAKDRGLRIVLLGKDEAPIRSSGIVNIRTLYSEGSKEDRFQPVATAYEKGRVVHVEGGEGLDALSETLTTWEPGTTRHRYSPGDLDAAGFVVTELLDLKNDKPDPKKGIDGLGKLQPPSSGAGSAVVSGPSAGIARVGGRSLSEVLGGRGRGGRI